MSTKPIKAIVLAAGKGTRMQQEGCDLPKVMRLACNEPLLSHVLKETGFIPPADTIIVVGYMKEQIISAFPGYVTAVQEQQRGTGHAVMAAMPALEGYSGDVLICYGDMPLIRRETYQALIAEHRNSGNDCTLLSGTADEYLPYGRIVRDSVGNFKEVVEDRDCTPAQKEIRELNTGLYVFNAEHLASVLAEITCANSQNEYYLTDAPALMLKSGLQVGVYQCALGMQIIGVNTPAQLELVERELMK